MEATTSMIPLACAGCHVHQRTACCYCDIDLCEAYTPVPLSVCAYAKARKFRSWKPEKKDL